MKHIMLTHPQGISIPVNPAAMMTWGPYKGDVDRGDGSKKEIEGTIIAFADGQNRIVLETPSAVTQLFDAAVSGGIIQIVAEPSREHKGRVARA